MFGGSFNFGGFAKGIAGFINASNERKAKKMAYEAEKKWVAYNNTMRALTAAQDNNTLTMNQADAKMQLVEKRIDIMRQGQAAKAAAQVSANTAGAAGGSVEATLFDIGRNAARAGHNADSAWEAQDAAMQHKRHKIAINLAAGKQFVGTAPAMGPSPVAHLFSAIGGAFGGKPARTSSGTSGLL